MCDYCEQDGETEVCADCENPKQDCCCSGGFAHKGSRRTRVHTARRDSRDGHVKKGDRYKVTRTHCWRENGPSWWQTVIRVLFHTAA